LTEAYLVGIKDVKHIRGKLLRTSIREKLLIDGLKLLKIYNTRKHLVLQQVKYLNQTSYFYLFYHFTL